MNKQMRKRKYIFEVLPPVDKKLLQEFRENADKIYPPKVVPCDDMRLEIGFGLIPLVEKKLKNNLQTRIEKNRKWIIKEYGFQIPTIHIIDNTELDENEYRFYIKGKKIGGFKIPKNKYICLTWNYEKNKVVNEIQGKEIKDPAFGVPAFLISKSNVERYFNDGHTIADAPCIISTHIEELIKSNLDEYLHIMKLKMYLVL
jgi:flagellar biosynthesis protein FlhA